MTALQVRLRAAMKDAMKSRDKVAVGALRSVLGEIGNAEAVPLAEAGSAGAAPSSDVDQSRIAGASQGVGASEMALRDLSDDQVVTLVRAEIDGRRATAEEYRGYGQLEQAERLDAEAAVLESHLR